MGLQGSNSEGEFCEYTFFGYEIMNDQKKTKSQQAELEEPCKFKKPSALSLEKTEPVGE